MDQTIVVLTKERQMTQQRRLLSLGLTTLTLLLWARPAAAIGEPYVPVTDEELARMPLIVVARWPNAKRIYHDRGECHTELIVERVLKGNLSPGRYQLLFLSDISWQPDGTGLTSYYGPIRLGDEYNVTKPTVWFLSRKRSWNNATDRTLYLSLDSDCGVQPLALEPFYRVLLSETPDQRVSEFLNAESPDVVFRALAYINGGATPWPFQEWHPWWPEVRPGKPRRLAQLASAVGKVLGRKEANLRSYAAAVYAELAGQQSVPRLRPLLADPDPEVRAVAVGVLARNRDSGSVESFIQAVVGIKQADLGCEVVGALAGWGDPRVVPALINFLQNDAYGGSFGEDIRIPALKAQAALHRITGCRFSPDVRASQKAWANARRFPSARQRAQSLRDALGDAADPLRASAEKTQREVRIKVTNRSRRTIYLTRRPLDTEVRWDRGGSGGPGGPGEVTGRGSFLRLAPSQSVRWGCPVPEPFMGSRATLRQVTLLYARHGHEFGVNAWMGLVRATVRRVGRHISRSSPRTEATHG
jgi:hypothetical protein